MRSEKPRKLSGTERASTWQVNGLSAVPLLTVLTLCAQGLQLGLASGRPGHLQVQSAQLGEQSWALEAPSVWLGEVHGCGWCVALHCLETTGVADEARIQKVLHPSFA